MASETTKKKLSLDASALLLIGVYYPEKKFPRVWESLAISAEKGEIYVIDKIYAELARKDDFVHSWLKKRKDKIVKKTKSDCEKKAAQVVEAFGLLVDFDNPNEQADPYIIADAILSDSVIVTGENGNNPPFPPNRGKDKIPDVCGHYKVECIWSKTRANQNEFALRLFDILHFERLG